MSRLYEDTFSEKYLNRVKNLFENKKWEIKDDENKNTEFDRFCKRLALLEDDEQRDLILELTEDYLKVSMGDYERYLVKVWKEYFKDNEITLQEEERFCICPLLPEKDFGKVKSSTMMLYLCQGIMMRDFDIFSKEQVRICESPKVLKEVEFEIGKLVLIDDFIGSGETGIACLSYIDNVPKEKINVISLVAQEEGITEIEKQNVKVYTAIRRGKGITDRYETEELQNKIETMQKIEKNLKINSAYKFGFNQSEALVSMIKTPNNTFPVYWYENNNIKAPAPFPRKENIKMLYTRRDKSGFEN